MAECGWKVPFFTADHGLWNCVSFIRGHFSSEESKFHLHWIPVNYRILFKVLLLVFDCLQGLAPAYLHSTITLHIPGRSGLRTNTRSPRNYRTSEQPRQQGDKKGEAIALPPITIRDDPSPTSLQSTGISSRQWLDQQPTGANSTYFLRLICLHIFMPKNLKRIFI